MQLFAPELEHLPEASAFCQKHPAEQGGAVCLHAVRKSLLLLCAVPRPARSQTQLVKLDVDSASSQNQ